MTDNSNYLSAHVMILNYLPKKLSKKKKKLGLLEFLAQHDHMIL